MDEFGGAAGKGLVLNDLATTLLAGGDSGHASDVFRQALRQAERAQSRYEVARAHNGLAASSQDVAEQRQHWQQALELFTDMGTPERHEVAERLKSTRPGAPFGRTSLPSGDR